MNPPAKQAAPGAAMALFVLWLTYGAFYFCRVNIAAAVPGLQDETGYTKTQIGLVLGALKLAYGIGQLINGQLAERFPARWLLAAGLLCSAALNVLFGFSTALYFLVFVWACNGYAQALGWTPCIRVTANWFPPHMRGRAIGTLGTGYQLAGALAAVLAGWSAQHFGWRGAFWVPAGILVAVAAFMLFALRETPAETLATETPSGARGQAQRHREDVEGRGPKPEEERPALRLREGLLAGLRVTLTNPALWLLALSLCLLDAVRYGFVDWGLTHLKEVQGGGVDTNALKISVIPLGGIVGAQFSGWVSDRFFGSRRAPVITGFLLLLGVLTLFYERMSRVSLPGTVALLVVIGFAIFGAQVLLVGTAPADLARNGTAAAAAGFVNFMGYMGAFAGDQLTGHLVDRHGWQTAVWVWACLAFGAAACAAPLWNVTAEKERTAT